MPVFNPGGGAGGGPFICLVSCFLFVSVVAGGGCLLMYMILPEPETKPWLPIAGVTLVCFPWFFWFLTFIYRLISRGSGLRFGINGNAGGAAAAPNQTTAPADIHQAPAGEIGAAAMVELGSFKDGKRRAASLSRNSSSINVSHESEMPLAKSMAS